MARAYKVEGANVHWYGKDGMKKGRKVGHINIGAPTREEARRRLGLIDPGVGALLPAAACALQHCRLLCCYPRWIPPPTNPTMCQPRAQAAQHDPLHAAPSSSCTPAKACLRGRHPLTPPSPTSRAGVRRAGRVLQGAGSGHAHCGRLHGTQGAGGHHHWV
jgi:hypothetical protein